MADQWMIKAREFSNCNCDSGCPCQYNSKTTYGTCEAVCSIIIDEGYFNDTKLDGLPFLYLIKWPGEVAEGNGTRQLIIDERADQDQRTAIEKIATGQSTAPGSNVFFIFDSTVTTSLDTIYAPIQTSIDIDARKAVTKVEGLVESIGSPLINPFNGEETRRGIHLPEGFEFTYAEVATGKSKITAGIELTLNDSHAHFCILHFNQDGLIRNERHAALSSK